MSTLAGEGWLLRCADDRAESRSTMGGTFGFAIRIRGIGASSLRSARWRFAATKRVAFRGIYP